MRGLLLRLVPVCLFLGVSVAAQRVNEERSAVSIDGTMAVARLVIDDAPPARVNANIELLDTTDKVIAADSRSGVSIGGGEKTLEFKLPLGKVSKTTNEGLAWYRLRYRIGDESGVVSLSQLLRDLFELRIIGSGFVIPGTSYRARVRAVNPFTQQAVPGVRIETALEIELAGDDDNKLKLNAAGVADAEGFSVFDFPIPIGTRPDDGEITVTGRHRGIIRTAKDDLDANDNDTQVIVMTDKPIYQPGQNLSLRGIVMKGMVSKTVLGGSEVEFRIEDDDGTLLYREKVIASEYGIAAIQWRIPTNAKLGDYRIEIRDSEGDEIGRQQVKVTRYDLPNFAVSAKPSKPFYLPEDREAEIDIKADYLFGKPVTKGKVRVVRETSRQWNWREQKYDIEEAESQEGEIDADAKFTAKFDLRRTHDELKDIDWKSYEDLRFAAYFTDLTTNKTEQRRFDVRVSREPIHTYLIPTRDSSNGHLPVKMYVSTFYADGTPAECDVEIQASAVELRRFLPVGRVRTNKFGAGKIETPRPPIGDANDELNFRVIAKDATGKVGTKEHEIDFTTSDNGLRISTDRVIRKPGDPINLRIDSTVKQGTIFIDVIGQHSVIESRSVPAGTGRTSLTIPYNPKFKGELTIAALIEDPNDADDEFRSTTGVIYPAKHGIDIDASFDKAIYKPNEEATVKFGIVDRLGRAVESALGVVVFDKAVEERARTDADFGGMRSSLSAWLGYGNDFGGVNVKDLNDLDLTKAIPDDLQLVAEIILREPYHNTDVFSSRHFYEEAKAVFSERVNLQMQPVGHALKAAYEQQNFLHPTNETSLQSILDERGISFDQMRDPWGTRYVPEFSVEKNRDVVTIRSIGPDKRPGTRDDFTALSTGFDYFTAMGRMIDMTVVNYHARTGKFIRDEQTLFSELGVRELLDRFGRPYRIEVDSDGRYLQLRVKSAGPDGQFGKEQWSYHDFYVWTSRLDFFSSTARRIGTIQAAVKQAPQTEAEFRATLKAAGLDLDELGDGNGNPPYINVDKRSRFWNKTATETVRDHNTRVQTERSAVIPVTQEIVEFTIRSAGADRKARTWDDVTLTQVVHILSERSRNDEKTLMVGRPIGYTTSGAGIEGIVTDAAGAVVPATAVTLTNTATGETKTTTSNDDGRYVFTGLAAGIYSAQFAAPNFKIMVIENIAVNSTLTTTVDATLEAGSVSETVSVVSGAEVLQTQIAMLGTNIQGRQILGLPIQSRDALALVTLLPGTAARQKAKNDTVKGAATDEQTSTPRVREYFPETLYWAPEIVTTRDGRAEVKFRMADNITTWKMYTIASTKDGKIGFRENEVTAFQAFFVDLDPPKFLTVGDEIHLPTQVRNYTGKKQNVSVKMSPAGWFTFLDADTRNVAVDSSGSENAVFGFKAITPTKDGPQKVTAIADKDSDAIERKVMVRPDGREVVNTDSRYITGSGRFDIDFPTNALPNTRSAELKIYPNLMAHVAESVEGLLRRPYGCGEQTISSTYPNVMILKFADRGEGKPRRISEAVERKARKYLQSGYERLLGYQVADGGFSYWGGKDAADFSLTAYALRFLSDASAFIEVDQQVLLRAQDWLTRQQRSDGSWNRKYNWETAEDDQRSRSTTVYVARTLAMLKAAGGNSEKRNGALQRALGYMKERTAQIGDPYSLALFGLAAVDAGDLGLARTLAQKLTTLGKEEGGGMYWDLASNTAFNGWGNAGRIETTALVTQLFLKLNLEPDLVNKAMSFLIRTKDSYGVWYSTQTTINVLDALVLSQERGDQQTGASVHIVVNGGAAQTIDIPPDKLDQIVIDLNGKLADGKNVIEIRSTQRLPMMVQTVATHYIAWSDADTSGRSRNQSRALRLDYKCDRTDAVIMDEVSCTVEAERVGYRGYGMLLAEIGTPPGADVNRESLQAAIDADWSISRYDVLPDRIIVYMWSKTGGTKFNFRFRPRYAINAQTPPSTIYDYYNPEAQASVAPLRFAVK